MTPSEKVKEYRRTVKGLITLIYSNQKMCSKGRNHPMPSYSKEELTNWILSQPNFNELWNNWVQSGYERFLSPSVDRIDNHKSYSLDNIQLVTWRTNLDNMKIQNKSGEYLPKSAKAIQQMDLLGNVLNTYESVAMAARAINAYNGRFNISRTANGKFKQAYGYKWAWV